MKRLAHSFHGKVRLIRMDASCAREVQWSGVEPATDADEAKEIAIVWFADKILPQFPGYKVGGQFDIRVAVASDAGWAS